MIYYNHNTPSGWKYFRNDYVRKKSRRDAMIIDIQINLIFINPEGVELYHPFGVKDSFHQ